MVKKRSNCLFLSAKNYVILQLYKDMIKEPTNVWIPVLWSVKPFVNKNMLFSRFCDVCGQFLKSAICYNSIFILNPFSSIGPPKSQKF